MTGERERGSVRAERAIALLRVAAALLLIVHGIARITLGIVDDFGTFLTSVGLPAGPVIAWAVTCFELAGGVTLAAGRLVRPIAIVFCLQLLAGIVLVHRAEGWFVVGAGRNGMEYSALLIAVFAAVAWADAEAGDSGR